MTFTSIPFARASHYALGPDGHVHHTWSDSLRVSVYSRAGNRLRVVEIPFAPVPVTDEDREQALEGRRAESRAMVEGDIPDTKPAFDDFLIDGEGRYWFKRPTADPDTTDWWIADPSAQRVRAAPLPSTVDLMAVRGEHAYGRAQSPEGAPALVRYRVDEQ